MKHLHAGGGGKHFSRFQRADGGGGGATLRGISPWMLANRCEEEDKQSAN